LKLKKYNQLYGTVTATIIIEIGPQNYMGIPKIEFSKVNLQSSISIECSKCRHVT
jgi:hypothetical protein